MCSSLQHTVYTTHGIPEWFEDHVAHRVTQCATWTTCVRCIAYTGGRLPADGRLPERPEVCLAHERCSTLLISRSKSKAESGNNFASNVGCFCFLLSFPLFYFHSRFRAYFRGEVDASTVRGRKGRNIRIVQYSCLSAIRLFK